MSDGVGSKVELVKAASHLLRGSIAEELRSDAPAFSAESYLLLKFHGTYQQDDRDVRAERRRQGLEPDHICMVRVSIPGGILTPSQYLAMDELCDVVGNGTLRITSRQGIQFHFVSKSDLHSLIATLNEHLLTTLGACGDVARNTTCCPAPVAGSGREQVSEWVQRVARHFRPKTQAYFHIWLDGECAVTAERPAEEPFYGNTYVPRKFKIGFSAPDENCIDVYSNDVGVVPLFEGEELRAFTLLVGGGMGKNHAKPDTFPRLADPLTTVEPTELIEVLEAIAMVHRDQCNRDDRDHARLKYLVEEWGIDRVRAQVSENLGRPVGVAEPLAFDRTDDHLGWHDQGDGRWFLGVKVENGRVVDTPAVRMRSALRAVVEGFAPGVRFTSREDVLLTDIGPDDRRAVDRLLADHGVKSLAEWEPIARHSFACPALPTCGLALAESERVMPTLLASMAEELGALGLGDLDVHVRMTGCPNGCARPYTTEIGIVGRGKNRYDVHLGGETVGLRMNEVFCENVPLGDLVAVLRPVFVRYRDSRSPAERFGDFCHRIGVDVLRAEDGNEQWVRTPATRSPARRAAPVGGGPR
jgi:sulfite reductase (ferredoxin)